MLRLFLFSLYVVIVCVGETLPPEVLRLASARRQVASRLQQTRNYTCVETVDREKTSNRESARTADVIRVEVAYVNGKEVYALPRKPSFSNDELAQIIGNGFTITGIFAAFARNVFLHNSAFQITFGAAETLDGTAALRYDYHSNLGARSWNVQSAQQSGFVDQKGSFWVASADLRLLRLRVAAANIPPNLPYSRILVSIDYSSTGPRGEPALLPKAAVVEASDRAGDEWLNRIDFSQCHQFEAKAQLLTDAAEVFGSLLAPGLELPVELVTPILVTTAITSMPVEAVTVHAIQNGDLPLPQGSRLHGKIRRLTPFHDGYLISIEFDTIDSPQGEIPFVAMLTAVTPMQGLEVLGRSRETKAKQRCKGVFGPELAREECGPRIPGVINFVLTNGRTSIDSGTRTVWKTGGFEAPLERQHQ